MRRQSKRSSLVVSTPSIYSIQDTPPSPLSPVSTNLNFTGSDPSIPHVVPSRSHSPSANNVLTPPGRAKTISSRARYHLPSDWITPYRTSPASEDQVEIQARGREESRFTPSSMSRRSTYSPIIFANSNNNSNNDVARASPLHSRSQSRGPTPSIMMGTHSRGPSRLGGGAERESPSILLRGEEEKIGMKFQVHGFTWDGQFILDSEDCVSGSLRWAKIDGDEETSSIKTGMQLAEEDEDENLPTYMRRQSIERKSPAKPHKSDAYLAVASVVGPWRQIPPRLSSAGPLWRIIAFQLFLSLSQIIAPISSLNDMATHKANPSPFGTQHVALLMMAWAPCLVFGFDISWRREG